MAVPEPEINTPEMRLDMAVKLATLEWEEALEMASASQLRLEQIERQTKELSDDSANLDATATLVERLVEARAEYRRLHNRLQRCVDLKLAFERERDQRSESDLRNDVIVGIAKDPNADPTSKSVPDLPPNGWGDSTPKSSKPRRPSEPSVSSFGWQQLSDCENDFTPATEHSALLS